MKMDLTIPDLYPRRTIQICAKDGAPISLLTLNAVVIVTVDFLWIKLSINVYNLENCQSEP